MTKKALVRAPAHKVPATKKYTMGTFPKNDAEWIALADDMFSWAHLETSFAIVEMSSSRR